MVARPHRHFVEDGLNTALNWRSTARTSACRLDGSREAKLVELTGAETADGVDRWTLRLVTDGLLCLGVVPARRCASRSKDDLKPWQVERLFFLPRPTRVRLAPRRRD